MVPFHFVRFVCSDLLVSPAFLADSLSPQCIHAGFSVLGKYLFGVEAKTETHAVYGKAVKIRRRRAAVTGVTTHVLSLMANCRWEGNATNGAGSQKTDRVLIAVGLSRKRASWTNVVPPSIGLLYGGGKG